MIYEVEILETLRTVVTVEAESVEDAEAITRDKYDEAEEGFVLDSGHHIGTDFMVEQEFFRQCTKCGTGMNEGYCCGDGEE